MPEGLNEKLGIYEYVGVRKDCPNCSGIFMMKENQGEEKVTIIHNFESTETCKGWNGLVIF